MTNYDYNSIPVGYYDLVFKRGKGIQSAWHNLKFSFLIKFIPNSGTHLDVGCGPGTFVGNFRNSLPTIGIDISENQINYANENYKNNNLNFIHLKSRQFPFPNNSVDSVSLVEVIEHLRVDDINELLAEIKRCLKSNGVLILSTPNYSSMWPFLEYLVNKFSKLSYEDQHISKFNTHTLVNLMKKNGFKVKSSGTFLFLSPFLAFFSWKLSLLTFKIEHRFTRFRFGFLSFCIAVKSEN
jgi:ubiquinone/menaquinone biosynthesis C-methylase UbiE